MKFFWGVKCSNSASGSKPLGNTKNNRISQPLCSNKTNKEEDQSRSVKSRKNKKNRVVKTECNAHVMQSILNVNSKSMCAICNECLFDANHDMCLIDYVNDVNVVQIILWYLDFGCSKHMIGNRSQLINFISKFLGTVRFRNDPIAKIMDLEVAFRKHTCYIRDLEGVDLLKGSRDLSFLHVFGALCYPNNDSEDHGLVPQPPSPTPNVPPTKDDWDVLFQPMFDEFFKPPASVDHHVPLIIVEEYAV
ncbi:hypothetical protein Tco_0526679 [Tanacetum coccineum]